MKIYLDNAATTKMSPEVLETMKPYLTSEYYNPSAVYSDSKKIKTKIEDSRAMIASFIGAEENEIYFTSGGTESDNLACHQGILNKGHIITSEIEHKAILNPLKEYEKKGGMVTYLKVNRDGFINLEQIRKSIRRNTVMITVMMANNEIGIIEPVKEIGQFAGEYDILFHTDAVQAFGHIPVNVKELNVDMLSASAHKFNGPKGTGFIYVRKGVDMHPMILGGGQERGMRSGTENVPGIIGMAAAAEIAVKRMKQQASYNRKLFEYMTKRMLSEIKDSKLNGDYDTRLSNNINISFKNVDAQSLLVLLDLDGICASAGSACNSNSSEKSHVLRAIGLEDDYINGTIRMTLGGMLTISQARYVVDRIKYNIKTLRER